MQYIHTEIMLIVFTDILLVVPMCSQRNNVAVSCTMGSQRDIVVIVK